MTLDEVLSELPTTKWKIDSLGAVRTADEYCFCPISYIYYKKSGLCFRNGMAFTLADYLGIKESDAAVIVRAADFSHVHWRYKLLEACGLCEQDGGT